MSANLHQARQGFKFSNQTENLSAKTIDWYDSAIDRFETFLAAQAMDAGSAGSPAIADVTTDDIRQFIAHLQGRKVIYQNHPYREPIARPLSPYTIRGIVVTLSAFFNWSSQEGLITHNPMEKIGRPKVPKIIKERFSQEDIEKLLEACKQYPDSLAIRNRAMVLFLLDTGVRAGELVTLALDRLDLEHGRAHVTGKGMKDREVFIGKSARKVLWQYVTIYRPVNANSDRVFVTREGEAIALDRLRKILRDLGERAGVLHVHPHRFRHTAARLFIRNGGDAFALQRLLGHEGLEITRRYVELEREDVERAHARASPVDRWGLK